MQAGRSFHALAFSMSIAIVGLAGAPLAVARGSQAADRHGTPHRDPPGASTRLDRSGRTRVGTASVYAHRFFGRKMADGRRMQAHDDNAASKTLPLGTRAEVTNLETGRRATVTIHDRGPYAKGRIVDLSPATAEQIGITRKEGVAKVEVKPISVPPADAKAKN